MKKLVITLWAILFLSFVITNAHANPDLIKLSLITELNITKKTQLQAALTELTESATQAGVNNSIFYGNYKTQKLSNGYYRITIKWHTLGSSDNQNTEKAPLAPAFISRFKTNQEIIVTGEVLTAKGDQDAIEKAYNKMKIASDERKKLERPTDENTTKPITSKLGNSPINNNGGTNAGVPSGTGSDVTAPGPKADLITTRVVACDLLINIASLQVFKQERTERVNQEGTVVDAGTCSVTGQPIAISKTYGCQAPASLNEWYTLTAVVDGADTLIQSCTEDTTRPVRKTAQVTCPNRFDELALQVWTQEKTVTYDGAGTVISQTACKDIGTPYTVTKDYNACAALPDYNKLVVHDQYKYVANVNGNAVIIQGCTPDMKTSYSIVETASGCSARDDLVNNYSVQQVRLVYIDGAQTEQELRACQDSTNTALTYQHFNTSATCTPGLDQTTGTAILYERVAYHDSASLIQYVTTCAPTASALREEYCQTLTHNTTAGESYMNTRKYFLDSTGARVNIDNNTCTKTRLPQGVFQHSTTLCKYNHYDTQKLSKPVYTVTIDTSTDPLSTLGPVTVQTCTETNVPISHTAKAGSKRWTLKASAYIPDFAISANVAPAVFNGSCTTPTNAQVQTGLNGTLSWGATAINTNGWSKDFLPAACTTSRTFRRVKISRDWVSLPTCWRKCAVNKNTYIKETIYVRPDNTEYAYANPLSQNYNVCGGTTAKPPL